MRNFVRIISASFLMKIFDPNRSEYTKKIDKFKICEFCNKKNIKKQECVNLSGEYWRVFVNKYPYMNGNLMIIPKRHVRDIHELNKEEWEEFHSVLVKTKNKLGVIFKTKDFNVGLNVGRNAGASLEHMHWQIIPRYFAPPNAANIFADLYSISISPDDLRTKIMK